MLDISVAEGGVTEVEGLAAPMVRGGREGVLTQVAEEEEVEDTEVHDGFSLAGFRVVLQELAQGP